MGEERDKRIDAYQKRREERDAKIKKLRDDHWQSVKDSDNSVQAKVEAIQEEERIDAEKAFRD